MAGRAPVLSAVSSNANQLYTLLRCIGIAPKASVQITPEGIRFSVEESRVMQGLAFLDKALFTSYTFNPPTEGDHSNQDDHEDDNGSVVYPHFLISLSALLETLQIFGINDASTASNSATQSNQPPSSAFNTPALLLNRSCTINYPELGAPLSITLSEAGVTTTCELTAYEPDDQTFGTSPGDFEIPLQRDAIIMKIIMRSALLHDAIRELDSTNPTILTISASAKREPFFALSGSGGPFSESTVEFSIDKDNETGGVRSDNTHKILTEDGSSRLRAKRSKMAPTATETFLVNPPPSMGVRVKQNYRFALIRKAARAMAAANKVSIRGDVQGVLSLQFMIDLGEGGGTSGGVQPPGGFAGNVSFVDFRFVPLVDDGEGEEQYEEEGYDDTDEVE
ncbi:checkpoint clamp complex protein Rad1 [Paecilomyces lecythidis]|uniref:Checkpoint clamp complex protein Rad1 n=1 Tax=Paecilomyces lecythidis TaxID=3004212 RepID=A0ABR3WYY1_9EURO